MKLDDVVEVNLVDRSPLHINLKCHSSKNVL